jgi:RNA polymerase sigma factor (sigma-70 family)
MDERTDDKADDERSLTERFEAHRNRLRAVAYRMLGSQTDADDAVQEAWLRLHRSDSGDIDNLGGWLTTVVARVCLDLLRSRQTRAQVPLEAASADPAAGDERTIDPEQELLLAASIGPALLVVLDTLAPAERVAFVLHDLFAIPFEEIAAVLGRRPRKRSPPPSTDRGRLPDRLVRR